MASLFKEIFPIIKSFSLLSVESSSRIKARDRLTASLNAATKEEKSPAKKPPAKTPSKTPKSEKHDKSEKNQAEKSAESKSQAAVQSNQSYIMKLFDRSVNLAKFDESTPLYPIVREWLKNSPRQKLGAEKEKKETDPGSPVISKDDVVEIPKVTLKPNTVRFVKPEAKPDNEALDKLDYVSFKFNNESNEIF